MKPYLRWAILAAALLAVAGIIVIKSNGPNGLVDKHAIISNPVTAPAAKIAALPRLLELHGGPT